MKLKIDTHEGITILALTEAITVQHLPVLKAGLSKIAGSGRKRIVLDLTGVKESEIEAACLEELSILPGWAQLTIDALVIWAGGPPALQGQLSLADALNFIKSPDALLQVKEAKLKIELRGLEKFKTQLEGTLQKLEQNKELLKVKRENSECRAAITFLEDQISQRLKSRLEPYPADFTKIKMDSLHKTLVSVLEQDGLLPID